MLQRKGGDVAAPIETVRDISRVAYGFISSSALFTALELGVFTVLHDRPRDGDDLARELAVRSNGLATLLALLEAEGLVYRDAHGHYANSPAADKYLVRGSPQDYSEYLRLQTGRQIYTILPKALGGLRGDAAEMAHQGIESWLADPDEAETFSRSQHDGSLGPAWQLAKRIDLEGCRSLLDVAGGSGAFSITFCSLHPGLQATIIDFPAVVDVARRYVAEAELSARIGFLGGDALEVAWPVDQDLVLMSYLFCNVPGQRHQDLMTRAFGSTRPGGQVVIHDFMLDDDRSGPLGAAQWLYTNLPLAMDATVFTGKELAALAETAGFIDSTVEVLIPGLTKTMTAHKPA
jgi:ubiquinone/menaquinone biosynthesis C-methylase UbiE